MGVGYNEWTVHCFSGANDAGTPYCMIDYRLPYAHSGWSIASSEDSFTVTSFGRNARTCGRIEIKEHDIVRSWNGVQRASDPPSSDKTADAAIAAMQSHLPLIGQCQRETRTGQVSIADAFNKSVPGLRRAIVSVEDKWRSSRDAAQ